MIETLLGKEIPISDLSHPKICSDLWYSNATVKSHDIRNRISRKFYCMQYQ